jgi:hypothetical protein
MEKNKWKYASILALVLFTIFAIWWMILVQKEIAKEEVNSTYKYAALGCSIVLGAASIGCMRRYFKALRRQDEVSETINSVEIETDPIE